MLPAPEPDHVPVPSAVIVASSLAKHLIVAGPVATAAAVTVISTSSLHAPFE